MAKNKNIGFTLTAKDNTKAAFNTVTKGLSKLTSAAKAVGKGILGMTAAVAAVGAAFGAVVLK